MYWKLLQECESSYKDRSNCKDRRAVSICKISPSPSQACPAGLYLCVNPEHGAQTEGILLALFSDIHVLVNAIVDLPGDSQMILPFAAWPNNHISLVHGLHHLLCLLEADVVE